MPIPIVFPAEDARRDAAVVLAVAGEALHHVEMAWVTADEIRTQRLGSPVTLATRLQRPMDKGVCMSCKQERSVLFVRKCEKSQTGV